MYHTKHPTATGRIARGTLIFVLVLTFLGLNFPRKGSFLPIAYGDNGDSSDGVGSSSGSDSSSPGPGGVDAGPQAGGSDGSSPGPGEGASLGIGNDPGPPGPPGTSPSFGGEPGKPGGEVAPDDTTDVFGGFPSLGSTRSTSVADAVADGIKSAADNSLAGRAWSIVTSFFSPKENSTTDALKAATDAPATDTGKAQLGISIVGTIASIVLGALALTPVGIAVSALAAVAAVVIGVVSALSN